MRDYYNPYNHYVNYDYYFDDHYNDFDEHFYYYDVIGMLYALFGLR